MPPRQVCPIDLEALVHHMFDQVLEESERAELLGWIQKWEAQNPDVDPAHRVTGWIDVAYAFKSRTDVRAEVRSPVRGSPAGIPGWGVVTAIT